MADAEDGDDGKGKSVVINGFSAKVLTTLVAGLIAWTAFENVRSYAFRTKGERFTQLDGRMLKEEVYRDIRAELPPAWLVEMVRANQSAAARCDERLDAVESLR